MTNPQHGSGGDDDGTRWALSPTSRKPVPDLVGDRLRELIRDGELAPGDRLPTEPELARHMGVARSSVRTGLQRLEARGVVEVERGRGWLVSAVPDRPAADVSLDRDDFDVAEVMEVRIALESTAAALAAARAPKGTLDEIAKLARAHEEAELDDPATLLRTDEEFHEAILEAAGNEFLRALYAKVTPLVAPWRARSFTSREVHDRSAADHLQIAVQLRRRDEVGARLAMSSHLVGLYRGLAREQRAGDQDASPEATLPAYVDVEDEAIFSPSDES